jgi:hypothetical protein
MGENNLHWKMSYIYLIEKNEQKKKERKKTEKTTTKIVCL